jgi:NAD-dependent protein deacetylase/lipoamidase
MIAVSDRLRDLLAAGRNVAVLTGAGMSAESGVPTFRGAGGFWENESLEDLATPQGFARDPGKVWRWYEERRKGVAACAPNAGHRALAAYQDRNPGLRLITQNIDGLHQAAGSSDVVELHGALFRVRCTRERTAREDRRVPLPEVPPRCSCGALLRPDIVWFGEELPQAALETAFGAARQAALFLVIGTSAVVYPAAGLPAVAAGAGAWVVEINTEPTAITDQVDEVLRGPAAVVLPDLLGASPAISG